MLTKCLCALLLIVGWAEAQWSFDPPTPIVNLPFRVTTSVQVSSVFVSTSQSCGSVATGGSSTLLSSGSAVFQVSSQNRTSFFFCNAQTYVSLLAVNFFKLSCSPLYAFRNTLTTIQFPTFTPNGTVSLREYSDCSGGIGGQQLLSASKTINVAFASSGFYFVCLTFQSAVTARDVTTNISPFVVTDGSSFTPQIGVTNQQIDFEISGAAQPTANVFFSSASNCSVVGQGLLQAGGSFGKTVSTKLTLSRGSYTFCVEIPLNSGVYIPSGTLVVQQYTTSPRIAFAGRPTIVTGMIDSSLVTTAVVLATSTACETPFIQVGTPTAGQVNWTLQLGTFFTCVFHPATQTFILATRLDVVPAFTLTVPNQGVRSLPFLASSNAPQIVLGPSPSTPVVEIDFSGGTDAVALIPATSTNTLRVWVPTSDLGYWYEYPSISIRNLVVTHTAIFAAEPVDVVFDSALLAGYAVRVAPNASCASGQLFTSPISSMTLTTHGSIVLCVNGSRFGFQPVLSDVVYPVPSLSPTSIIGNRPTIVTIANVPTGFNITLGVSCANAATHFLSVGSATSASLNASGGATYVCATYPGTQLLQSVREVGVVQSFVVASRPTVQVVNAVSTYVIQISNATLLLHQSFFVAPDCSQPSGVVPILSQNGKWTATLTPTVISNSLHACVGNNSLGFVSAGATSIVAPFQVSHGIAFPTLPFVVTITGTFFQPTSFVAAPSARCNETLLMTGSLSASGTATVRLPQRGTFFLCVASDDGETLLPGGSVEVGTFSATSTTLVRLKSNLLLVTTQAPGTSLYLSLHTNCSGVQYVAAPVLTAPPGQYTVCQTIGGYAAGSSNQVLVVDDFVAAVPAGVRSFVPFTATISSGDTSLRTGFSVFVSLTDCNGTRLSSFQSSNATAVTVVIPTMQFVKSALCIRSADGYVTSQLAEVVPLPYMVPYTIVSTVATQITSGATSNGFGLIAPDSSCTQTWMTGQIISGGIGVYVVPASQSTTAWYCESTGGSQFQARGTLSVVHLTNVTTGAQTVIRNQTVLPGTEVIPNVDNTQAFDPYFSRARTCDAVVDLSRGYIPNENEAAYFFVCVLTADRTLRFTTNYPSVHVLGYSIAPRSYPAGVSAFTLSSSLPASSSVAISSSPACTNNVSVAQVSGISGTLSGGSSLDGIHYLCVHRTGAVSAIVSVLFSRAYSKSSQTLAIAGAPICFRLVSNSVTFSLVDEGLPIFDPFRPYYSFTNRSFFMGASSGQCSSGLGVISAVSVTNVSNICVRTEGLSAAQYSLCVGTPSGFLSIGTVTFGTVAASPTSIVSGGFSTLSLSGAPSSTFALGSPDCQDLSTNTFASNASSMTTSFRALTEDGGFLPTGLYALCMLSPIGTYTQVTSLTVTPTTYYGVSNSRFVQQVPTILTLLRDLEASAIVGIRTTASCQTQSGIMTLSAINSTKVLLTATSPGTAYLCATTPVNNSVVMVAALLAVNPFTQFTSEVASCTDITVGILQSAYSGTTVTLLDAPACCTTTADALVTTSTAIAPLVRRMRVTDAQLESFEPRTTFSLCASNTTQCYHLGSMQFVSSACALTPTPQTPAPGQNQGNSSNNDRQNLVASDQQATNKDVSSTIILVIVFAILILVVVVIIFVQCCIRSRRVIPVDVENPKEGPNGGDSEWKRTFDSIVSTNKRGATTAVTLNAMLNVPISMRLDTCREAPIPMQLLELSERDERAVLVEVERNTFARLTSSLMYEIEEMRQYTAAMEKTRVLKNISYLLETECMSVMELEESNRAVILDEEEERRLGVVDIERQRWRQQVDVEGRRLKDALERDPFWKSRRKLLLEANMRAMQSVQASPAAYDPSPNRTLMVDQTELEARYKEKELYY